MLDYQATDGCRMEFLRRELDDPEAAACGRCDNCTGQPWPADVPRRLARKPRRDRLARPGVEVEPRKMWPTGMKDLGIDASGKIPASRTAEPGRALGRLTDVGWGATLRALLAEGAPDEPVTAAAHRRGGQGARRLGLGAAARVGRDAAVPHPAACSSAASASGSPRSAG